MFTICIRCCFSRFDRCSFTPAVTRSAMLTDQNPPTLYNKTHWASVRPICRINAPCPKCAFVALTCTAAATQQNPPRRVRLAGDSLELLCTIGNGSAVVWDMTPRSDTTKSVIISSSRNQPANSRYKVECNTTSGTCRLLIIDLRQTDAGLYRCMETTAQYGVVTRPLADLTVLAAVPTCTTLVSYKTSYLLDDLKIRCQVNYSGTEQPFIHCRELSTNISPSPATPVASGNNSYRTLSFTYDIDVDRITKDTRLECITSLNMNDFPHGHVQYTWRWQSDITGEVKTQSNSSPPVSTTTTPNGEASSSSSSTSEDSVPADAGATLMVIVLIVVVAAVLGVITISVLIGVAIVRRRTSQVTIRRQGDSQHQRDSTAVYHSPPDQQHGYVEITSTPLSTTDAIYENVPRQEPHYINLNPSTVELPSRTPKIYTTLNVGKGAQSMRDLVEQ